MVGTVHRVTERGDIRVQFDGNNQRWTFHPRAIHRLSAFSLGDAVRLTDDVNKVKQLQKGHGVNKDQLNWNQKQLLYFYFSFVISF